MRTPNGLFFLPFIISLLLLLVFACEKEDFDWRRQKISFVQVEVIDAPIKDSAAIILTAKVWDIEDPALNPSPELIAKYGHLYADSSYIKDLENYVERSGELTLEELEAELKAYDNKEFSHKPGESFFPDFEFPDTFGVKRFNTRIPKKDLAENSIFHYLAYAEKPSDKKLYFSPIAGNTFNRPIFTVLTEELENSEVPNGLRFLAAGRIIDADDVQITEVGHYLYVVKDDGTKVRKGTFLGKRRENSTVFFTEISFFSIEEDYKIQAYVKYIKNSNAATETGDEIVFRSESRGGFWIRTDTIIANNKHAEFNQATSPTLSHAVSFVPDNDTIVFVGGFNTKTKKNEWWEFDTRYYNWKGVGQNDIIDLNRDAPVYFVHGDDAYLGWGSEVDDEEKFRTDFRRIDLTTGQPMNTGFTGQFKEELDEKYGAEISDEVVDTLMVRAGAFFFSNGDNGEVFFGGGKGIEFVRRFEIPQESNQPPIPVPVSVKICSDAVNADCQGWDVKDWIDFNQDGRIDWGEWVDKNGDGEIHVIATEKEIENVTGLDFIPNDNIDEVHLAKINGEYKIQVVDKTGVKTEKVINYKYEDGETPVHELASKKYIVYNNGSITNIDINRAEWYDTNFNEVIDLTEINLKPAVKGDLWKITVNSEFSLDKYLYDDYGEEANPFQRYGATAIYFGGHYYLLGGADKNKKNGDYYLKDSYVFNNDYVSNNDNAPKLNTLYGFSFIIGNEKEVYFGGGEELPSEGDVETRLSSINVQVFDGSQTTPAFGCGLSTFSRGISFSAAGKGFIGFGTTDQNCANDCTKGLWMYIPSKQQ